MTLELSEAMVTGLIGLHLLTLLFLVITVDYGVSSLELVDLRVPAHVVLDTRASLSCRWSLGSSDVLYSVKWYKDGKEFFRHVPRDQEPRRKFSLPGVDVEQSDVLGSSLVLSAATPDTGGRYRCEVSGEGPLFPTVSRHADMAIVVLPNHGPVITGLRQHYLLGDQIQVNCTSGRSRPSNILSWYINGEPAPEEAVHSPVHKTYEDQLETTSLLLSFEVREEHFRGTQMTVKCLARLGTLYWRSTERSTVLEKTNIYDDLAPRLEKNTRTEHVHSNLAWFLSSSRTSIIVRSVLTLSCIYIL